MLPLGCFAALAMTGRELAPLFLGGGASLGTRWARRDAADPDRRDDVLDPRVREDDTCGSGARAPLAARPLEAVARSPLVHTDAGR